MTREHYVQMIALAAAQIYATHRDARDSKDRSVRFAIDDAVRIIDVVLERFEMEVAE